LHRHLREHCFDNLFAYPERVAALFEAEPRLGRVLPQFANTGVKAEFRLQQMIGRAGQTRDEACFPAQALKRYFRDEIARMSPRGARLARAALRRVHRWVKR